MDIILAIALVSLAVFVAAITGRLIADVRRSELDGATLRLTVADIQARLAAEYPRTYVPISRRW
ncbi:hypothetical protein [Nocardia sp. NBC_00511]|uniref:hypothetical protein n=1 Tax=Nocardia sp. NBC_00511 TaxID=2903591 RepID=UPI0030E36CFA